MYIINHIYKYIYIYICMLSGFSPICPIYVTLYIYIYIYTHILYRYTHTQEATEVTMQ